MADKESVLKKRKKNCGSAVIEMTLLISIFLGLICLYIFFFLYEMQYATQMEKAIEKLYENDFSSTKVQEQCMDVSNWFEIQFELQKSKDDFQERIRRWQLLHDTISERRVESIFSNAL